MFTVLLYFFYDNVIVFTRLSLLNLLVIDKNIVFNSVSYKDVCTLVLQ